MKRKKNKNQGQLPLPLNLNGNNTTASQGHTIPAPPIEPYVKGECHCECPGCSGKFGPYRHCGKGGCGLPRGSR